MKKHPAVSQRRTQGLFLCFLTFFILVIEGAERTAAGAPFVTGLGMDGNICPGELGLQVGFKVIGKIMTLQHGNVTRQEQRKTRGKSFLRWRYPEGIQSNNRR